MRWLLPVAVFSTVIALRLLPADQVITAGGVIFVGPDSYDHMRRVTLMLHGFPSIPAHNYYQGYPVGSPLLLAPLYDFLIALSAWFVGLGSPTQRVVELAGALTPLVAAVAAVAILYLLGRELMEKEGAFTASLVFGMLPAYLLVSFIGNADNNAVEPFIAALYFVLLLRAMRGMRGSSGPLLAALSGVFAILMWRGATLFWAIGLGTVALSAVARAWDRAVAVRVLGTGGAVFVVKGLLLGVLVMAGALGLKDTVSFREISYFHAMFALIAGLLLLAGCLGFRLSRSGGIRALAYAAASALVLVAASVAAFPSFWQQICGAVAMMGQGDIWSSDIMEYGPLLFQAGELDLVNPTLRLTFFFWLLPLWVAWLLWRLFSRSEGDTAGVSFLVVSTVVFFVSALSHRRFENLLAINVALLAGFYSQKYLVSGKAKRKMLCVVIFAALLSPSGMFLSRFTTANIGVLETQDRHMGVMDWLRENTPETSYYYETDKLPEYGVMAEWSLGSWVENIARRPVVATNFGDETYGLRESVRFMLAEDEETARSILRKNNARYVIITNIISGLETYARMDGRSPGYAKLIDGQWRPGDKYFGLVSTSLLLSDGIPSEAMGLPLVPLRHFRLLYESRQEFRAIGLPRSIKKIKVFEHVEGASIDGTAVPGARVELSLRLLTNEGRTINYKDATKVGHDGRFHFVVPYPTEPREGSTSALGPYVLESGGNSVEVSVEEKMLKGKRVYISLL